MNKNDKKKGNSLIYFKLISIYLHNRSLNRIPVLEKNQFQFISACLSLLRWPVYVMFTHMLFPKKHKIENAGLHY